MEKFSLGHWGAMIVNNSPLVKKKKTQGIKMPCSLNENVTANKWTTFPVSVPETET